MKNNRVIKFLFSEYSISKVDSFESFEPLDLLPSFVTKYYSAGTVLLFDKKYNSR